MKTGKIDVVVEVGIQDDEVLRPPRVVESTCHRFSTRSAADKAIFRDGWIGCIFMFEEWDFARIEDMIRVGGDIKGAKRIEDVCVICQCTEGGIAYDQILVGSQRCGGHDRRIFSILSVVLFEASNDAGESRFGLRFSYTVLDRLDGRKEKKHQDRDDAYDDDEFCKGKRLFL